MCFRGREASVSRLWVPSDLTDCARVHQLLSLVVVGHAGQHEVRAGSWEPGMEFGVSQSPVGVAVVGGERTFGTHVAGGRSTGFAGGYMICLA